MQHKVAICPKLLRVFRYVKIRRIAYLKIYCVTLLLLIKKFNHDHKKIN